MHERWIRLTEFLIVVLLLTGLYFFLRTDSQKTVQRPNHSAASFALAMQSWQDLGDITQNFREARQSPRLQVQMHSLLETTITRLQACDRNELERSHPGWGAQRDLFLSAAFGYLQGLEKEELWSRDLRESQLKLENFYSWMESNRTDLEKFFPNSLMQESKSHL